MTVPRRAAPGARTARPAPLPLVAALVAAWPVCLPLGAQAQEATGPVVPLEPVVISVDRREQRSFDAPAAVSTVDARTVREAGPQVNLSESLVRVPGISVLNRQNYAQDLQLSVRGFGARSTFGIRGVRLIVDGIPATMPDGQGQASTISLPSVERIEVLRGPMAQLHGNAAGGVVLVSSRVGAERPTVTFDSVFAPWDTQKVGLTVAMTEGDHAFLIDASQLQTGGWRDHSEASRGQANLRWRWQVDADTRLDLVVNALDQRALDPLGLTRAQWEADPQQAPAIASVQDPRKTVRQEQAGAVLQHRLSPATSLQARLYTGERSLRNALSVPVANQQSVTSSGGIVEFVRPYDGLGLLALHRIALEDAADGRARSLRLGVGLEQDRMREDRQGYVNNGGVRGVLKRDEDNLVRNRDLFAQLGWDLRGDLTLDAGVRRSQVRFRTQDRFIIPGPPTNPDDSGSLSYAATLPVLGLAWRASADLNLYANVGRGFETPTFTELAYRSGGLTGLNTDLKPGRSRHAEVGTKWRVAPRQRLDLAVFDIRTSDDLVVDTNTGGRTTFRNATRTRRSGVELGWSADWGPTLSSQVSATVLRAVFDAPFTSGATTVNAGQRLPGVPAHNAFAGLDWRPRQAWGGFNGGVEVVRQGRIAVNDANTDTAPAATLLNLRAGFGQKAGGWELRQDLRLENATDERYAGSVIVNEGNQRFFEPAMPRSVMLRLSATLRQ